MIINPEFKIYTQYSELLNRHDKKQSQEKSQLMMKRDSHPFVHMLKVKELI
jgi:hypothetical protein